MKVLILSITAGGGHNSTAKALSTYFSNKGIEVQVLDTYHYLNKLLGDTVSKGYLLSISNAKLAYEKIYSKLEKRKKNANQLSATRLYNYFFIKKMKKYIDQYDPDAIICTHIFAGIIIDILKQKREIRAKTYGILTDFTFHPYWEESLHFDYIVTPNELLNRQAQAKGFTDSQILPLGIPIDPKFGEEISKTEARTRIGLETQKTTILVMGGSMGYGDMESMIEELDKVNHDFQIISICGGNKEAKETIDSKLNEFTHTIKNYGFTSDVYLLMSAADCIITKPGGLTTSEALAKRLPIIINSKIPGQENRNTIFLLNAGVAMTATEACPTEEVIYQLFSNPKRVELMRNAINIIRKPNSTEQICEFVISNCNNN